MSIVSSRQLGATPLDVRSSLSLEDIASGAGNRKLDAGASVAPTGWGSTTDLDGFINYSPQASMPVHEAKVLDSKDELPRRLHLRFYWTESVRRAGPPDSGGATWQYVSLLQAVDVLLFEGNAGSFTALVTTRRLTHFKRAYQALEVLLRELDESSQVVKDNTSRALSDDLFLWLFYRCEGNQKLIVDELRLGKMQALSSVNSNKSARFRDGASLDRIELVSMIAVSAGKFGPARFSIDAESPSAAFELELHLDGGFQPMRTSEYDDSQKEGANKGVHLIEDLWVSVLPRLRAVYEADTDWRESGRDKLREQCLSAVRAALDSALG